MRLARYVPQLTLAELNRFHLSPADACDLAAVGMGGDLADREARKFLSNVSDRGMIPFEKRGEGKTSPKLYSLKSVLMLRCLSDLTGGPNRRTYEYAKPIAEAVGELAEKHVQECAYLDDLDTGVGFNNFVVYGTFHGEPRPAIVHRGDFTPETIIRGADNGVYAADELIWNILNRYPDYWARDRVKRGLDATVGRYDGCDAKGQPLDISHHWYADLSPVERAKRLVEIKEYIAARETKQGAD